MFPNEQVGNISGRDKIELMTENTQRAHTRRKKHVNKFQAVGFNRFSCDFVEKYTLTEF